MLSDRSARLSRPRATRASRLLPEARSAFRSIARWIGIPFHDTSSTPAWKLPWASFGCSFEITYRGAVRCVG